MQFRQKIYNLNKRKVKMQAQNLNKYKIIKLQQLQRKPSTYRTKKYCSQTQQTILSKLDNDAYQRYEKEGFCDQFLQKYLTKRQVYCYKDTGSKQQRIINYSNNFFSAFFIPYNHHGDVVLSPDQIWLMISIIFSKYVDDNAQKLRDKFVQHEGQMGLVIKQFANSKESSQKLQKQWDYFFDQILVEVQKNTFPEIVELLICNFSTTTKIHKVISTSLIMASFQQYFSYQRRICLCGINNLYFEGTREDWVKLHKKLLLLNKFDIDGKLKKYIERMDIILNKFIQSYDGKPDVNWWNTIMTKQEQRIGSGSQVITRIQGWILHFFNVDQQTDIEDLPQTRMSVPISLINEITNQQKELSLFVDWVSVSKVDQHAFKPDIGVCIVNPRQLKQ